MTFNDRAEVIIPARRNQNLNILEARISLINARGGTEILQGLETGYNEVIQNLKPDYSNHIILITDGRTYGDEEGAMQLAQVASSQSITIHALGIGNEWNDEFLEELSSSPAAVANTHTPALRSEGSSSASSDISRTHLPIMSPWILKLLKASISNTPSACPRIHCHPGGSLYCVWGMCPASRV